MAETRHKCNVRYEGTWHQGNSVFTSYRVWCTKIGCDWKDKTTTEAEAHRLGDRHEKGLTR